MKRRYIILSLLAVVLVLGLSVGNAWSYFTDSATAEGSVTLSVKPDTRIEEDDPIVNKTKVLRIYNDSDVVPVWVRARAYVPTLFAGDGTYTKGENWSEGGLEDWHVYSKPLAPGEHTDDINVKFNLPDGFNPETLEGAQEGDEYNIVVIYECLPVSYDAAGNPQMPAGWK